MASLVNSLNQRCCRLDNGYAAELILKAVVCLLATVPMSGLSFCCSRDWQMACSTLNSGATWKSSLLHQAVYQHPQAQLQYQVNHQHHLYQLGQSYSIHPALLSAYQEAQAGSQNHTYMEQLWSCSCWLGVCGGEGAVSLEHGIGNGGDRSGRHQKTSIHVMGIVAAAIWTAMTSSHRVVGTNA